MAEIPENLKEIIDSSIKAAFAPFEKILEQSAGKEPQEPTKVEKELDGVSECVKAYIKDMKEQPFAGKQINTVRYGGCGTRPSDIEKM